MEAVNQKLDHFRRSHLTLSTEPGWCREQCWFGQIALVRFPGGSTYTSGHPHEWLTSHLWTNHPTCFFQKISSATLSQNKKGSQNQTPGVAKGWGFFVWYPFYMLPLTKLSVVPTAYIWSLLYKILIFPLETVKPFSFWGTKKRKQKYC